MSRTLIFKQETRKTRRHSYGYRTFISFLTTLSHLCLLYIVAGVLMESSDTHLIRPSHQRKFRPAVVKECVREIVRERLSGVQYNPEEVTELSRSLAECIKDKVKNAGFDRYKLVVQVVIGEQRGQGVKMSSRCFWDADTDSYAEDIFMNDSLFCVVAVFGSYYY